ncbi:MAG TPA: hypothetical protein VFF86_09525, partial [Candidatus Methylomirabilis sp.]|nr:hypothetical protein [Candidatus Methylomirabilis sp.]
LAVLGGSVPQIGSAQERSQARRPRPPSWLGAGRVGGRDRAVGGGGPRNDLGVALIASCC